MEVRSTYCRAGRRLVAIKSSMASPEWLCRHGRNSPRPSAHRRPGAQGGRFTRSDVAAQPWQPRSGGSSDAPARRARRGRGASSDDNSRVVPGLGALAPHRESSPQKKGPRFPERRHSLLQRARCGEGSSASGEDMRCSYPAWVGKPSEARRACAANLRRRPDQDRGGGRHPLHRGEPRRGHDRIRRDR